MKIPSRNGWFRATSMSGNLQLTGGLWTFASWPMWWPVPGIGLPPSRASLMRGVSGGRTSRIHGNSHGNIGPNFLVADTFFWIWFLQMLKWWVLDGVPEILWEDDLHGRCSSAVASRAGDWTGQATEPGISDCAVDEISWRWVPQNHRNDNYIYIILYIYNSIIYIYI